MNLVYDFLKNKIKLCKNDKIVIGVSAGPDSMFLLYILLELKKIKKFQIIVAHINHNVRFESKEEEEFLKKYCLDHDVIFESIKIEKYNKENFHLYARNIRYEFYKKLINKYQANYLMTAHHGDDLIETILMRLTRGSTFKGYFGMSLISNVDNFKIVRPLLYITKEEIKEIDDQLNIPYRIDKSNLSDKYTRNRYRKQVLPFLKEENKNVHLKFLKFSNVMHEANEYIENQVNKVYDELFKDNRLNINLFNKEDLFIRKIALSKKLSELIDIIKLNDNHIESILYLINNNQNGSSINLPNNIKVSIEYGYVVFNKTKVKENYCLELKDGLIVPNGMQFINIENEEKGNDTLHLDFSLVKMPLFVRNRKKGDYIELKGTNGRKKVSDIFIDCKIPRDKRNDYPIVVDSENKIIWIPKLKKSKFDSKNYKKCDIIIKCL